MSGFVNKAGFEGLWCDPTQYDVKGLAFAAEVSNVASYGI